MNKPDLNSLKVINIKKYNVSNLKGRDKKRVIAYLYIIYTLVAISFFGLVAINPTLSTISNLKKEYEDEQLVEQALSSKISAMSKLNFQYLQIKSSIDSVYQAIPKSPEIPTFERQVEIIAQRDNFNLSSFSFGALELYPDKDKTLYTVNFNIGGSALNETDLDNFINDLTNLSRIIRIDNLNITYNKSAQTSNPFTISIIGKIYFNK